MDDHTTHPTVSDKPEAPTSVVPEDQPDKIINPSVNEPVAVDAPAEAPVQKPDNDAPKEEAKTEAPPPPAPVAQATTADTQPKEDKQEEAAAMPDDAVITGRIRELLKEVDLATTSEKMLRKRLQEEFKVDLSSKKALLRAEIQAYLEEQEKNNPQEEEEDEASEEEEEDDGSNKRKKGSSHAFGNVLSEPMREFLGMQRCPRTQVVKKIWEYVKANKLQLETNKRIIVLDDKLKTLFPGERVDMFKMQKHLSRHVFKAEDVYGGTEDEAESDEDEEEKPKKKAKKAAPKPKAKAARRASGEGGAPKVNGFTKPVKLSPEMAAWMGSETASRPQITKHLWAYVKGNNLQDPSNKQFVLSDDTLKKLTGEDKFQAFGFAKLVKQHILGYAD